MHHKLVLCADSDIEEAIVHYLGDDSPYEVAYMATDYAACYEHAAALGAAAIIIQGNCPLSETLLFLDMLEASSYFPMIILFEKKRTREIAYVVTDFVSRPDAMPLAKAFEEGLRELYPCRRLLFRPALPDSALQSNRQAALQEILRGCNQEEIEAYRHLYSLDLRGNGYYLLFWEFQSIEYRRHKENKDIYNFVNDISMRGLAELLATYAGGEEVHLAHNRRCFILNDLPIRSQALKTTALNELMQHLSVYLDSPCVNLYLSNRIASLASIRAERDIYENNKSLLFFLRDTQIVRPANFESVGKLDRTDEAIALLQTIGNYLHYDIGNPTLQKVLHRLYCEVIKPTLSFPLYYYCVATICSFLVREGEAQGASLLDENLSPERLRFSSLEEQCKRMADRIAALQSLNEGLRKTKNVLILQALEYIQNHYDEDIRIPDVAGALFVSQVYLSRVFQSVLHMSIIHYLVEYRIGKAKKLLEETDASIAEVAMASGFREVKHFSRTFHHLVGLSPASYRKKERNS